jgi:hypothetical protein
MLFNNQYCSNVFMKFTCSDFENWLMIILIDCHYMKVFPHFPWYYNLDRTAKVEAKVDTWLKWINIENNITRGRITCIWHFRKIDPDPKGRNWRYWSPSTEFFLFSALLSHCVISLCTGVLSCLGIPLSVNGIYKVAVAVQRQSVIHTENSGFASPTLGQHISTFRGYRILFSSKFTGKNDYMMYIHYYRHDELIKESFFLILKVAIDGTGPRVLNFFSIVLYCLTV